MKKVALAIMTLLGLLGSQAAQAWEWPFFSKKEEPPTETLAAPAEVPAPRLAWRADDFSEDRLKFVVRSYAQSFDLYGDQAQIEFDGRLLATRGQSAGFAYRPTDYLNLYAEYSGFNQFAAGPFANDLDDLGGLAWGWSAGAEANFADVTAGLKYFDYRSQSRGGLNSQDRDSRDFNPLDLPGPAEDFRTRGLEFSASWAMDQTFNWNFELRPYFSFARLFDEPSRALWAERQESGLRFSYGLVFSHEKMGLAMSVEANNRGRRTLFHYPLAEETLFDSTVYDFHLVKRLYDWKDQGRLLWKADVTNIGDAPTSNVRNKNEEGRTFKTGLRYEY
jgi:hypothetical protein